MTAQRTLAVMVCSYCGRADCHEGKRISLSHFDSITDAGIFLEDAGAASRHANRTEECALALEMDHDFHEHDANAQWKSPSRKIIEAEITGYEMELAGLRGEGHSMYSFDYRADAIYILEGKIEALKLLASKFD